MDTEQDTKDVLSALKKDYVAVEKSRIKPWYVWVVIGLIAGVAGIFFFVSNKEGEFEAGEAAERNVAKMHR